MCGTLLQDQLAQKEQSIQEQERTIAAEQEEHAKLQRTQSELLDVKEQVCSVGLTCRIVTGSLLVIGNLGVCGPAS